MNHGIRESDTQQVSGANEPSPIERYQATQTAFEALMASDFPHFDVQEYASEKAAAEGVDQEKLSSRIWAEVRAVPTHLDINSDGKMGLDDAEEAARRAARGLGRAWTTVTAIPTEDVSGVAESAGSAVLGVGRKVASVDYASAAGRLAHRIADTTHKANPDSFRTSRHTLAKIGKTAIGVQGLQNRSAAAKTKQICEEYAAAAEELTDARRVELNVQIEEFGAIRLSALHDTLGRFLQILAALNQHNRVKEYELLSGLGIETKTVDAMGKLDMTVSQSLSATAVTGVLGAAAVMGTPVLVTSSVAALASASTGTAISTLSGAAASNAVMAWLGGGAVAAGGGGMAAGTIVLAGITAGTSAGVALLSAGIIISVHYSRKLTETKAFEQETALAVAGLEKAWVVMDGISRRVEELSNVTGELKTRLIPRLNRLESLVPTFDPSDRSHAAAFNQCGLLIKTMVELAQTPLLDDEGNLSEESLTITAHVKAVLNTEV